MHEHRGHCELGACMMLVRRAGLDNVEMACSIRKMEGVVRVIMPPDCNRFCWGVYLVPRIRWLKSTRARPFIKKEKEKENTGNAHHIPALAKNTKPLRLVWIGIQPLATVVLREHIPAIVRMQRIQRRTFSVAFWDCKDPELVSGRDGCPRPRPRGIVMNIRVVEGLV